MLLHLYLPAKGRLTCAVWQPLALLWLLVVQFFLFSSSRAATFTVNMLTGPNRFSPANLTIDVGDTVTWVNQSSLGHDTVSGTNLVPSGVWNSNDVFPPPRLMLFGDRYSFTFNVAPGGYGYYCTPHAFAGMVGVITVRAGNTPPSVAITNPVNGAIFGEGANILIQATASDANGTVTRVDFRVNGVVVGSVNNAPYEFTITNATAGNYALSAVAVDNQGASTTSATVNVSVQGNAAPSVTITNPPNGATFVAGTAVLIEASAFDTDGTVTQVAFFTNGVAAGVDLSPPFAISLGGLTVGPYTLTATATDDRGAVGSSVPVNITIVGAPEPPSILAHPRGQTVSLGSTVSFSVSASGTPPLFYQWQFNGTDITGATTETLLLTNVQTNNAGSYSVVVSNAAGSASSQSALLTVLAIPHLPPVVTITSPTNGAVFTAPANVTVMAAAFESNGVIARVQFFVGTNLVATLTNTPYAVVLTNLTEGTYPLGAVAIDTDGLSAASPLVNISVIPPAGPPIIVTQPQNQTVSPGGTATFSVRVTGTAPFFYQWQFNGSPIADATRDTFVIANAQPADQGSYSVIVSNAAGSVVSAAAELVINNPPLISILSPPDRARFPLGGPVLIEADASDTDGPIAAVEFFFTVNSMKRSIGVVTNAPYRLVLTNLSAGLYVLSARATDNFGATADSPDVRFTVHNPPAVTLTRLPTNDPLQVGTTVQLNATATPDSGLMLASLQIFANGVLLATSSSSPLNFDWSATTLGDFILTAVATDVIGQSTTSSPPLHVRIYKPEIVRPINLITNAPANFTRLNSPQVILTGSATDDVLLERIEYQLNGGPPIVISSNVFSTRAAWALALTNLAPGVNTVRVRSVDLAGNASFDATRFYTYIITSKLRVRVQGAGTVKPNLDGQTLQLGQVYTMKAQPGLGQLFAGWTFQYPSNSIVQSPILTPSLNFRMEQGLTLVATFAPNPFPAAAGTYNGLFLDTNHISLESSGATTIQLRSEGSFSGKLIQNGSSYPFSGKFDPAGNARISVVRPARKPVAMGLHLDVHGGGGRIIGSVTNAIGTNSQIVVSELVAERNPFNARANRAPQAGGRSFAFRPAAGETESVSGTGSATIRADGRVQIRGTMNGTAPFSLSITLSRDGFSPLYISSNFGTEVLIGWLQFANDSSGTSGTLFWLRPNNEPIELDVGP